MDGGQGALGVQAYSHVGGLFDYVLLVEGNAVVDALPYAHYCSR